MDWIIGMIAVMIVGMIVGMVFLPLIYAKTTADLPDLPTETEIEIDGYVIKEYNGLLTSAECDELIRYAKTMDLESSDDLPF